MSCSLDAGEFGMLFLWPLGLNLLGEISTDAVVSGCVDAAASSCVCAASGVPAWLFVTASLIGVMVGVSLCTVVGRVCSGLAFCGCVLWFLLCIGGWAFAALGPRLLLLCCMLGLLPPALGSSLVGHGVGLERAALVRR